MSTVVHRHPVKGLFAGLCLGIALAILLVLYGAVAFGTLTPYLVVVLGVALGVVWAFVAPPRRQTRVAAPATLATPLAAEPELPPPAPPAVPNLAVDAAAPLDVPPAVSDDTQPGWLPTHTVPPDGLDAYAGVEAGGGVSGRLDPGLEVQVLRREGDWANIVCSNGWNAWVDARRLIERAP